MPIIDNLKERIKWEGRTENGVECEAVRAIRDRRAIMKALAELLERSEKRDPLSDISQGLV